MILWTWMLLIISSVLDLVFVTGAQTIDSPRGPWQLVFKVISGKWNSTATGHSTFWDLLTSSDTYTSGDPFYDVQDFTSTGDTFKSDLFEQWENNYVSVQAIKLSFFKNNKEQAYVVFNALGKTKSTWFKCNNILYASYIDLPDNSLTEECPGRSAFGLPLTMMKISFFQAPCASTTGWLVVTDTNLGFSPCPTYLTTSPTPSFKYSNISTVADLSTELETADSMAIFFQVWDLAFKGIAGIKPTVGINNLTGLFISDMTENDDADTTVRNLQHTQISKTFKSNVINMWDNFFIDTVKFSMLNGGVEQAYVVFDATNKDKITWFSEETILYSSYGIDLDDAPLDTCSIEGDNLRNWQIQTVNNADGCTEQDQLGWMLVKEPKNNGSCTWDTSIVKKPYFLYTTGTTAASPSTFQYADVMAVFVHGWRMVLKIAAGGSVGTKSSVYALWTETGTLNDDVTNATYLSTVTSYKSAIVDHWDSNFIRAVKLAAYKGGSEVFSVVFDGTASSNTNWLDCSRLLYTSVSDLSLNYAANHGYTCSFDGASSTFRLLLGTSTDCGTVSFTGVFGLIDVDSACTSRADLPQFMYSSTTGSSLTESNGLHLADMMAIFVDMDNCYGNVCSNGGTCQDIGGDFRCFCTVSYYGNTCSDLDGTYGEWSEWSSCSVTCDNGTSTRSRVCSGTEGNGVCPGESEETNFCTLDPCPVHGGYSEWGEWSQCTVTCGTGSQTRSRDCNNPVPQYGGDPCSGESNETINCNETPCPVDGGFTDWTEWGTCSVTCANGTQSRSRTCTNPEPAHGGANCVGNTSEEQPCDEGPCPVDGGFSDWSTWGTCTVTCGTGTQTRTRDCNNPAPAHGGADCTGNTTESQSCEEVPCPVDGGFADWSEWDTCSVTCAGGIQNRTRTCTNPEPAHGGADCVGETTDQQSCNEDPCPVDGGFSDWSAWDTCSVTCGTGTQTRTRDCTNPAPAHGGADCTGNTTESQSCDEVPCPVDGGFTDWSVWGTCSVTCASGTQSRSRTCTNPEPAHGGADCVGETTDEQACDEGPCPVDGGFSDWSAWGTCTVTCGTGTQTRTRDCTNPAPAHGGADCTGNTTQSQSCDEIPCPVDGGFTDWSAWGTCSVTCASGTQSRTRTCTNPEPAHGGADCTGETTDEQACDEGPCPVDGGFSDWSAWGTCSVTCGTGTQTRTRDCTNPAPAHGGADCTGNTTESQSCDEIPCPVDGGFTDWSAWGMCSVTCASGTQSRTRTCTNPEPAHGGADCVGETTDEQACDEGPCPVDGGFSDWSAWDTCSVTCGTGTQTRTRDCTNPAPAYGGADCTGNTTESQSCDEIPCPVDGGFTEWSTWGTCSVTCASGTQSRTRTCTNPEPVHGGADCTGETTDEQDCDEGPCPVDGGFSDWSAWGTCSVTCGTGIQARTRDCTNPAPAHGGADCTGNTTESQSCEEGTCPVDGGFTDWSAWGACSVTCASGTQSRTRTCTNPEPAHGGASCTGETTDEQVCDEGPCPVDGGFSDWTAWGTCSVTCATGTQTRTRDCTNPVPAHGGADCTGNTTESQNCEEVPCPVDGGFADWSAWGACSVTCASGTQSRSRTCTNPEPAHGGADCTGETSEEQSCDEGPCPVDGGYSDWSAWGTCSVTCGSGTQTRARDCTNPAPAHGGADCTGNTTESQNCGEVPCPVAGGFTEWSVWGACSVTCGSGTQSRTRTCTNPEPAHGGADCTGETTDEQACDEGPCPVDGSYSDWSAWDTCSVTCGTGTQTRTRDCTNPTPAHGGTDCTGNSTESQSCEEVPCPVDGGFTDWTEWGACSATCAGGTQSRSRTCTNPEPAHGGADCTGETTDEQACDEGPCPVDGGFSDWSAWDTCTVTCGTGTQTRTRDCTNPTPSYGGADCTGNTTETQNCEDVPCPVDGGFTSWSAWDTCPVTCASGTQSRTRTCTNPEPAHGGADCVGDTADEQACDEGPCPVDGGFSDWSAWGTCSVTCGTGTQTRTRDCTNPAPAHGGADCTGNTTETQNCEEVPCPVDGGFGDWSAWDTCSVTCGSGEQTRARECTNPAPAHGGAVCVGNTFEEQVCDAGICQVDGGFSDWSAWDTCTVTCGTGTQTRTRDCTNPAPAHGGADCTGNYTEYQTCVMSPCPVHGGYGLWGEWGSCSVTCDEGVQVRTRTCDNPAPAYGGLDCIGEANDTQLCNDRPCPVDGGYGAWSEWVSCSLTCGQGTTTRFRTCSNPEPQNGGALCSGNSTESKSCDEGPCPIDGQWSDWGTWSTCPVTCGTGTQARSRTCTNPEPAYSGATCTGVSEESRACDNSPCPVNGEYSSWSAWTTCSDTCGGGTQVRTRDCTEPAPAHGGEDCLGHSVESQTCNEDNCPVDGGFTAWGAWLACSITCGDGTRSRTRSCTNPEPQYSGANCTGPTVESQGCHDRPCPIDGGFTDWTDWSSCSVTCGDGTRSRSRDCTNPPPQYGGFTCSGDLLEAEYCNITPCPVDGGFTSWSDWSACSVTCGTGARARSRTCTDPEPAHGGADCSGDTEETQSCDSGPCPIDGQYSDWGTWSACSKTCGSGIKVRSRDCDSPAPQNGGQVCVGEATETLDCVLQLCSGELGFSDWSSWDTCTLTCGNGTKSRSRSCVDANSGCDGDVEEVRECNTQGCPVDGGFSDWSTWDTCSVTCGTGTQARTRDCTNPAPAHGGADCTGNTTEDQTCVLTPCPVDGTWSVWTEWSVCTSTCGTGTRDRSRTCSVPQNGGLDCLGASVDQEDCELLACPVDGYWTDWNSWSMCTLTCGGGTRYRERTCIQPQHGGDYCLGDPSETELCGAEYCPVDGTWTEWSQWSTCSLPCGLGTRTRNRTCTEPQYGGQDCSGLSQILEICVEDPCPVDGVLTEWTDWSTCTVSCGGGTRVRSRTCQEAMYGGVSCNGESLTEEENCGLQNCPVDAVWSQWSNWSSCSATCNGGTMVRNRTCSEPMHGGRDCTGHDREVTVCGMDLCPTVDGGWTSWSEWDACSITCGFGERSRRRTCTNPSPQWGGSYCTGQHIETEVCRLNTCPVDGAWSEWSAWLACFNMTSPDCKPNTECTCGYGIKARERTCDSPVPADGGEECEGDRTEISQCNVPCFTLQCNAEDSSGCQVVVNVGASKENAAASIRLDDIAFTFLTISIIWFVL